MRQIKKVLLFGVFFLSTFINGYSQIKKGFEINGNVPKTINGRKVNLKLIDGKSEMIVATTIIKMGTFKFKGSVPYPQCYIINFENLTDDYFSEIPIFIENTKITVSASSNKNIVTGSASHDLYKKYIAGYQPLERQKFKAKFIQQPTVFSSVKMIDNYYAAKDSLLNYELKFIKENGTSPVALYVARNEINSFNVKEIDDVLAALSPDLKALAGGKDLLKKAAVVKRTAVGARFADFTFNDHNGNIVKLSDHLGKGNYLLLDFWASWCHACRYDISHLKKTYELYHPAGFEVISISMDDSKENWLAALKEEQMSWLQLSDSKGFEGNFAKIYNFSGLPHYLLISPEGEIISREMRGTFLDKKLIELYGNKFDDKL